MQWMLFARERAFILFLEQQKRISSIYKGVARIFVMGGPGWIFFQIVVKVV